MLNTWQSEIIDYTLHGKTYTILLKTVDLCLKMSSDSINSSFDFVLKNFSCLSILENLDVLENSYSDSSVNSHRIISTKIEL